MDLIKVAEEAFATGKKFPEFKAGDTITVAYKIIEGSKERIQLYRGVVIKIAGHGDKKRFKKSNKERFHNRSLSFSFVVLIGADVTVECILE